MTIEIESHPQSALAPTTAPPFVGEQAWLELFAQLAEQPNRIAALQTLTVALQNFYPHSQLRIARGGDRLKEIFDARLGRLGVESSLHHELSEHWQPIIDADKACFAIDQHRFVLAPETSGLTRIVFWIPPSATWDRQRDESLHRVAASLATVLASRPAIAVGTLGGIFSGKRQSFAAWAIGAILLLLAMLPVSYRVRCKATLEPVQPRIVSGPFEATLLDCHVQPGDTVSKGQVLLTLDGRRLQTEIEALTAEQSQDSKEESVALAKGQIAESQLAALRSQQLQQRINLLKERLDRILVRSPMDGVVISGDMRRSIGSPIDTGQPLLEIAPLEQMRIELAIPEADVLYVASGAEASVRFHSLPRTKWTGHLESITPSAEIRDNNNVFVGNWTIANEADRLRPGMQGYAVVYGPRRPWAWKPIRQSCETIFRAIGW
ncbi:macrolide transporter subunit MacA [Roseimaritima multifibrata]|uniref:Macrolide transporter subunit MacA n=1 Tax=Roseimaritima multifibrata TaxID=1930274 RepID=A0A517MNX7_9BACT|nr:efflux RND transporter periplasmic adaptor subunit [Roseimaritima multifibrata]QDS96574.1 macrolide transporter subunit MacA [Roseimaritima multifibrata]